MKNRERKFTAEQFKECEARMKENIKRGACMFTKDMTRGGNREATPKLNPWATGAIIA
jgi:hypothetical protein